MNLQKPLIKRPARKRHSWMIRGLLAVLILALAGGAGWYFLVAQKASAQSPTGGKQSYTTTVKRGDIVISASGSGTLVASQSMDLSFSTSGTVAELYVKVGDTVKTGDVLARLGSADSLEASVASAQLSLLQAQQTLTTLQKNASVSVAQAYQDWLTAKKTYETALTTSQRSTGARCSSDVNAKYTAALNRATERLNSIHAETQGSDVYIAAKNDYDTALANYNYCIAYTADEKTTAQSKLQVAKSALQQAEDKYNTLKAASGVDPNELALDEARVKQAETALAKAQEALAGITLTAPIDGKVIYLAATAGAMVGTDKFITIADVSHPTLTVSIDEADLDKFVVGNTATVSFDALPDLTFSGKVVQVDPQLTSSGQYRISKGTIELDANSAKTLASMPLGLNATVKIISGESKNTLLLAETALKSLGNGQYSVSLVSSGQTTQQKVEVGLNDGTNAEIISGLKEGDVVSASGTPSKSGSSNTSVQFGGGPPPDGGFITVP